MSFSALPPEIILLEIAPYLRDPCDLFALCRVDRRTHTLVAPKFHQRFRRLAVLHAGGLVAHAAVSNWTRLLRCTIAKGGSVHGVDHGRRAPIVEAAHLGHNDVVRILLDAGADIEAHQGAALLCASLCHNFSTVQLLLARGAEVDCRPPAPWGAGVTPLGTIINGIRWRSIRRTRIAAGILRDCPCELEVIRVLLHHGADPARPQADGPDESLLLSVAGYSCAVARLLLDSGCDIAARDFRKNTALHRAIRGHAYSDAMQNNYEREVSEATVRLLVERGISVDAENSAGRTALHIAAHEGRDEIIEYLLSVGADPALRDRDGADAYDLWKQGREDGAWANRVSKKGHLLAPPA